MKRIKKNDPDGRALRHLAYERAESECIRILSGMEKFNVQLKRIVDLLLSVTQVSRAYLFENEEDPAAGLCMSQKFEACAKGIKPQIGNPELQHLPYASSAPSLLETLQARESYARVVSELEGPEREILEAQHILSVLIVPIFVGNDFWGFIGFDDCENARDWWEEDVRMLLAFVAEALAGALQRIQQEKMLDAQREAQAILLNNIQTQVWYLTDEHTYGAVNQAHAIFNRVPVDDLAFKDMYEIFPKEVVEVCRQGNREVFQTGQTVHTEEWVPHPSGEQRLLSITKSPAIHQDGTVAYVVCSAEDITERKQAEEALKESEANFRLFFESMTDIMVVATPEARVLFTNEAAWDKLGYTEDELAAMHLLDWHRPEDRNEAEVIFAEMLRGERDYCPLPLMAKDGMVIPVETRVWFGKWSGQDCVFGICKDLSAQQEAQQRFERIFRRNPSPMALSSILDRRFVDINDAFLETTGYTREEIIGKTSAELGLVESPEEQDGFVKTLRAKGHIANHELQVRRKDGALRDGLFSGEVIHSQGRECFLTVMIDITERKRAEAQLRLQSLVLNQIQDRVTVTDLDGVITYVNDAEVRALGYSRDELIGASTEKYGEDLERGATQLQIVEETLEHGGWRGEVVNRTANGEEVILDCRTQVVLDEEGNKVALAGIATDITERKRMVLSLQERLAQLMALLDSMQRGVLVENTERRIVFANQDFCDLFGLPNPEAILGGDCQEAARASANLFARPQAFLESVDARIADSLPVLNERLEMADGRILERSYAPVNMGERQFGHLWLYRDKTEQVRAEEALRRSEQRNRAFVSVLPDMLFRFDDEFRFVDCYSSQPEELLISPEQAVGKRLDTLLPEPLATTTEQMIAEALSSGQMQQYSYSLEIHSKERFFEARMVPVDAREVLAIVRDITDIRRAEQERLEMERQIQHTQKLESLGVLAGGIAHDFNNLLMSILGHADLALDELTPTSPARANIEQIETASRRAADLCAQMLAYSGRGRFIIEAFDVSTLIEEMAHLLRTSISKKAILNLQVEKNLPKIQGDATQIRQVIMNLVINASEAIGERSGVISVTTGACHFQREDLQGAYFEGHQPEGLYVIVEVTDTGCGMDQETLDRLFEPFFTTKFTGRGLGMSAVMGIVRGHKGILKVHSEKGKGTTFRILLPPSEDTDSDNACEQQAASGMSASNARVLLVEDEESVRALGQKMLERIGFQVTTASDGRQAVEVYGREGKMIDLVVLDLTMPHMDGEEALRELKRIDPEVRIVMASGYSNHEIEARLAGQGLLGFIQKPYTMAQLKERLYPLFEK